jgi:hypothetical protein
MWEERQIGMMQRLRAAREALEPPPAPRRRRGRPTVLEQVQSQIVKTFAQLPEGSPLLARLHGRLGECVAEARRDLERRARRVARMRRPDGRRLVPLARAVGRGIRTESIASLLRKVSVSDDLWSNAHS